MEISEFPKSRITPRETEVLCRVLKGHTNKVIATDLGISLQTTKNHVYHLFAKYIVRPRLELALRARSAANVTKDICDQQLPKTFESPVNKSLTNQRSNGRQLEGISQYGDAEVMKSPLTPRQTEILIYLGHGLRNKEIADKPGVIEQTIQTHVMFILRRLNVSSRTEAVVVALEQRLIALD